MKRSDTHIFTIVSFSLLVNPRSVGLWEQMFVGYEVTRNLTWDTDSF